MKATLVEIPLILSFAIGWLIFFPAVGKFFIYKTISIDEFVGHLIGVFFFFVLGFIFTVGKTDLETRRL